MSSRGGELTLRERSSFRPEALDLAVGPLGVENVDELGRVVLLHAALNLPRELLKGQPEGPTGGGLGGVAVLADGRGGVHAEAHGPKRGRETQEERRKEREEFALEATAVAFGATPGSSGGRTEVEGWLRGELGRARRSLDRGIVNGEDDFEAPGKGGEEEKRERRGTSACSRS